jgi:hypothetical protein
MDRGAKGSDLKASAMFGLVAYTRKEAGSYPSENRLMDAHPEAAAVDHIHFSDPLTPLTQTCSILTAVGSMRPRCSSRISKSGVPSSSSVGGSRRENAPTNSAVKNSAADTATTHDPVLIFMNTVCAIEQFLEIQAVDYCFFLCLVANRNSNLYPLESRWIYLRVERLIETRLQELLQRAHTVALLAKFAPPVRAGVQ